jgi:chloramphenicol-sensitive protein RarD
MNRGTLYALGAYAAWGFLPIYWKLLKGIPPLEILAHRMVWALLVLLGLLAYTRRWDWVRLARHNRRTMMTFVATAVLLSANWFVYIWAVNAGFIVETSLGYFINPLISVLFGSVLLGEKLRGWQKVAIGLALAGVLWLTISYGALPWISLTLAVTFGLYGLLRKTAELNALEGLSLEMMILFLPALAYLIYLLGVDEFSLGQVSLLQNVLLVLTGVITAVPLLLFALGARRVTLTTLGILQYLAPTLQFLIGVFLYNEPFSSTQLVGFGLIWLALAVYTGDGIAMSRRKTAVLPPQLKQPS